MLQALPRLSRAVERIRRVRAHLSSMAQNGGTENGEAVTAAIVIVGDEILKVRR